MPTVLLISALLVSAVAMLVQTHRIQQGSGHRLDELPPHVRRLVVQLDEGSRAAFFDNYEQRLSAMKKAPLR